MRGFTDSVLWSMSNVAGHFGIRLRQNANVGTDLSGLYLHLTSPARAWGTFLLGPGDSYLGSAISKGTVVSRSVAFTPGFS